MRLTGDGCGCPCGQLCATAPRGPPLRLRRCAQRIRHTAIKKGRKPGQLQPKNTLPPQEVGRHAAQRTLNTPLFMPSPLTPHRHCTATITQPRDSEKSRAGQQRLPLAPRCCCSHAALKRSAATHAKSLPSGAGAPALLSARQQSAANPPQQPHQARFQCIPTPLPKANTAFRSWPLPLLPAGSTLPKTSTTAISAAYHGLTDASVQCRTLSAAQTTCEHAWGALPRIEQVEP